LFYCSEFKEPPSSLFIKIDFSIEGDPQREGR